MQFFSGNRAEVLNGKKLRLRHFHQRILIKAHLVYINGKHFFLNIIAKDPAAGLVCQFILKLIRILGWKRFVSDKAAGLQLLCIELFCDFHIASEHTPNGRTVTAISRFFAVSLARESSRKYNVIRG